MQTQPVIPAVDPIPLPGPVGLFWMLLILTFVLHVIAMNCVVGGTLISIAARLRRGNPHYRQLAGDLGRKLPSFLAATITLGVAPLLFVQALYGRFFYSSSVIMAWPWFMVIGLLIIGYYASYAAAIRGEGSRYRYTSVLALGTFLSIAFLYTSNFTLMLSPAKWLNKYLADSSGLSLNLDEPMLWARLSHMVVGATAVAGLLVVVLGLVKWKENQDYARFLVGHGAYWFVVATMLQFLIGIWFLASLPQEKLMLFMGADMRATLLLVGAVAAALAAVFLMLLAARSDTPRGAVFGSLALIAVVLICMALIRDLLRSAYVAPYLEAQEVRVQWSVLVLFLVLFIGSLLLWGWMMWRYFSPRLREEAGSTTDALAPDGGTGTA